MGLKLPVKSSSIKSTLTTAVTKPSLKTVMPVVAGLAMVSPIGAAAVIGGTLAVEHKDAIKSTLGTAATTIKNDTTKAATTVEKVAVTGAKEVEKGAKAAANGVQNMMYMGLAAGGLVVLIMLLKH